MLQSTLAAICWPESAIVATAPLSPARLGRVDASVRQAQRRHAPERCVGSNLQRTHGPFADRVVCALQLAVTSRAQRMGDLLAALADSTRDEVALRLRIETSGAAVRSGVRTVLVFSRARSPSGWPFWPTPYLSPFDSADGPDRFSRRRCLIRNRVGSDGASWPVPLPRFGCSVVRFPRT